MPTTAPRVTDDVLARFRRMSWPYGDKDPVALETLEARVAAVGRRRDLITYSDLAEGVAFALPGVASSQHVIDVQDWTQFDRAMIGSFLGYMSFRSYERGGFFGSALVVKKEDRSPSEGFFTLLRDLGLIASSKSEKATNLWLEHVRTAHEWYAAQ